MIYKAACHLVMDDREEAIELLLEAKAFSSSEEFTYQLAEFREWETGCEFAELMEDDFIPEGRVCRKSYARPKTEPSWDDKVKEMMRRSSFV